MKRFFLASCIIALLGSCERTESPIQARAVIKGIVTLTSANGYEEPVQAGATVSIAGTELSATTDEKGEFAIEGVSAGTYNITIGKEGFVSRKFRGMGVLGGREPLYLNTALMRPSTAIVTNLVISSDEDVFDMSATLHQAEGSSFPFNVSACLLFLGNSADVSPSNYKSVVIFQPSSEREEIGGRIFDHSDQFPSGSTMFAIAYTIGYPYVVYQINTENGKREYSSISETHSSIVAVEIP